LQSAMTIFEMWEAEGIKCENAERFFDIFVHDRDIGNLFQDLLPGCGFFSLAHEQQPNLEYAFVDFLPFDIFKRRCANLLTSDLLPLSPDSLFSIRMDSTDYSMNSWASDWEIITKRLRLEHQISLKESNLQIQWKKLKQ
jgi:hypothetical protein